MPVRKKSGVTMVAVKWCNCASVKIRLEFVLMEVKARRTRTNPMEAENTMTLDNVVQEASTTPCLTLTVDLVEVLQRSFRCGFSGKVAITMHDVRDEVMIFTLSYSGPSWAQSCMSLFWISLSPLLLSMVAIPMLMHTIKHIGRKMYS